MANFTNIDGKLMKSLNLTVLVTFSVQNGIDCSKILIKQTETTKQFLFSPDL